MSRFASSDLRTIDLGDGEWVKIPVALSFKDSMEFKAQSDDESAKKMILRCVREWNIKDENGLVPELNEENIMKLDIATITLISKELTKLVVNDQDKKK